jgi:hypothetical protein
LERPLNSLHLHHTGTLGSSFLDHLNNEVGKAEYTYGCYSTSAEKCGMRPNKEWFVGFDLQNAVVASIPRFLKI